MLVRKIVASQYASAKMLVRKIIKLSYVLRELFLLLGGEFLSE